MLLNKEYKLHNNVILMIGTNDLKNVSFKNTINSVIKKTNFRVPHL